MASSISISLRALAAALPNPKPATSSPFLVLFSPTPPRRLLHLRSARRAPLAASDSFESSAAVDFADPEQASEDEAGAFALDVEASADAQELDEEVTASGEEEVGEYVEPPEEAKVYAGTVEVAEVIYSRETDRSRGFGFVTMSTVEEADKAVEMFNRYDINGRLLTVNKAAPRGSRVERPPRQFGPSFRVYVGNLPWQVDDSRLVQLFSEHGKVADARVVYDRETGRSKGFGFVTMATQEELDDAIAALDGQSLDGRALRVNVAEERPRRGF